LHFDHEVDGVVVPFAAETAPEIGLGVHCGVELLTAWTEKADVAIARLVPPPEHAKHVRQENLVAESTQLLTGMSFVHEGTPSGNTQGVSGRLAGLLFREVVLGLGQEILFDEPLVRQVEIS